jgi:hypothetical protein
MAAWYRSGLTRQGRHPRQERRSALGVHHQRRLKALHNPDQSTVIVTVLLRRDYHTLGVSMW